MASDVDTNVFDGQDGAEAFDEDNQGLDGAGENDRGEMRTFEEMPDVLDLTQAIGDADDDDALIGEDLDDDEIIEMEAEREDEDTEDDPYAGRQLDGETEPERLAAGTRSVSEPGEVGLAYTDDTDDEQAASTGRASRLESRNLDDDDLNDLGYREDR